MDAPTPDPEDWRALAECIGLTDLFFPHRGENSDEAKKVCARCPVRQQCFDWSLSGNDGEGEHFGIWGGLAERERRKARRIPAAQRLMPPVRLHERDYSLTRFAGAVVVDLDGRRQSTQRKVG